MGEKKDFLFIKTNDPLLFKGVDVVEQKERSLLQDGWWGQAIGESLILLILNEGAEDS